VIQHSLQWVKLMRRNSSSSRASVYKSFSKNLPAILLSRTSTSICALLENSTYLNWQQITGPPSSSSYLKTTRISTLAYSRILSCTQWSMESLYVRSSRRRRMCLHQLLHLPPLKLTRWFLKKLLECIIFHNSSLLSWHKDLMSGYAWLEELSQAGGPYPNWWWTLLAARITSKCLPWTKFSKKLLSTLALRK